MGHIFISYSHKDTDYAHELANDLLSKGFEIWIDERLDYGSQWPQEIQKQLDACDAFIIIMTPRSFISEWVQSELQRAKRKLKLIFPLLLEGDGPWLSVESTQYYDVRDGRMPDAGFFEAIGRLISTQPSETSIHPAKAAIKKEIVKEQAKPKQKAKTEIIIAVIGLVGTLLAALISSPYPEKWLGTQATPTIMIPTEVQSTLVVDGIPDFSQADKIDKKGIGMVLVPAGKFEMGFTNFNDVKPVHNVYLDAFYIDEYEVTNAFYKACVDAGNCDPPKDPSHYKDAKYANHPVVNIDWSMAQAYCNWRQARLPTEAEWEKAARGTDGRIYPWGEVLDETFANYNNNIKDTTSVGTYESGRSPYGAYDMAGNVWEWVADWYVEDYYLIVGDNSSNPLGPTNPPHDSTGINERVLRGGSWYRSPNSTDNFIYSYYRLPKDPTAYFPDWGFRCVLSESLSVDITPTIDNRNLPALKTDATGVETALVLAGEFTMGSTKGDSNLVPVHRVHLDSFYMDVYEVTNASYKSCVDVGICAAPYFIGSRTRTSYYGDPNYDSYPVIGVDWNMANTYCNWRNARLPTEAEWEKAARGTDERTYPWGEEIDSAFANYNGNYDEKLGDTKVVGSYEIGKSPYGIYDMAGNVWEWVADWYLDNYYQGSPNINPNGPSQTESHVFRGGSVYTIDERQLRSFYRFWDLPSKYFIDVGFRCARDATP